MTETHELESLCKSCVEIARDAGARILEIYEAGFDIEHKEDKSPLTVVKLSMTNDVEGIMGLKDE